MNTAFALASTFSFSLIALIYKDLRNKKVPTAGVMAIGGICLPLWITTELLLESKVVLGPDYWISLLVWGVVVYAWNFGSKYLYGYKSLTELKIYGTVLGLFLGILVDLLYFNTVLTIATIGAASLVLVGGLVLSYGVPRATGISWAKMTLILSVNCVCAMIAVTAYKTGVALQTDITHHVVFTQTLLYSAFFITGFRSLRRGVSQGSVRVGHLLGIFILLPMGTFCEAHAAKDFPVTVLVVLAVIPLVFFSIFDVAQREIHLSVRTVIAGMCVISGIALTFV